MKKLKFPTGEEVKYHNPVFKVVKIEGEIKKPPFGIVREEREVTLCQVSLIAEGGVINTIGVAITNPSDKTGDLGKTISEGRAIKSPIKDVTLISSKKLPKPLAEEQFIWAAKHVERNIDGYVNNIRETLK